MPTDTIDHPADACPYSWCRAHTACDCVYSVVQPHIAVGCRYRRTRTDDDQEHDDQ